MVGNYDVRTVWSVHLVVDAWFTFMKLWWWCVKKGGREREGGREGHQMPPAVDFPQVPLHMQSLGGGIGCSVTVLCFPLLQGIPY